MNRTCAGTSSPALDAVTRPLDAARSAAISLALRVRLGPLIARRERRIAVTAIAGVIVAFTLTVAAPSALFIVGPVLLGVPHVASDVRYLVLRRRLPAWAVTATGIACAAFVALRVLEETRVTRSLLRLEHALAAIWILAAMLGGAFVARAIETRSEAPSRGTPILRGLAKIVRVRRLAIGLPLLALVTAAALRFPVLARNVFVHAHNLVALGLWIALFRRSSRRGGSRSGAGHLDVATIAPIAAVVAATALLVSAEPLRFTARYGAYRSFGLDFGELPRWLAPSLPPRLAAGVAASYVFLQSIHYTAWLGWIPQEDVRAEGTLTFRMSARSLAKDFGPIGLTAIALAMLAVIAGAFVNARYARDLYVSLAMFHGYLELAMIGYFSMRGRLEREDEDERA